MTNGLVPPSAHLHDALASLHLASAQFTSANLDPTARAQAESTFLALRQSDQAVEYACFALEHSSDAYVLFQALTTLVEVLPTLPLVRPSQSLPELGTLCDFLVAFHLAVPRRSQTTKLPRYVSARACQAIAAVARRTLFLELKAAQINHNEAGSSSSSHGTSTVEEVIARHRTKLTSILTLNVGQEDDGVTVARIGLAKALLDEMAQTTQAGSGSKGSGKGRRTIETRWIASFWQLEVQPGVLQQVLASLVAVLHNAPQLNWLLVEMAALLERLLAWRFVIESPYAGLDLTKGNGLSVEETRRLLAADDQINSEDDDDANVSHEDKAEGDASDSLSVAALTAGPRWIEDATLLSTDLVKLMGAVYDHATRSGLASQAPATMHQLRACLLQLARFRQSRAAVSSDQDRLLALLDAFDALVAQLQQGNSFLRSQQLVDVCFCAQFATALSSANITALPLARLEGLLSTLASVTAAAYSLVFGATSPNDDDDEEERQGSDTLEAVLGAWYAIVDVLQQQQRQRDSANGESHLPPAIRLALWSSVVQPYIDGRLAQQAQESEVEEEEEEGEEEQPDWVVYGRELLLVGSLARLGDVDSCLIHLATLLDGGVRQPLEQYYGAATSTNDRRQLEICWDKLHWLSLIVGHVVADESKGEVASTPRAFFSLSNSAQAALWHLVDVLGLSLPETVSPSTTQTSSKEHSPQVTATLLWFAARIAPTYLLVSHTPLNTQLDGAAGVAALSRVVGHVETSLVVWRADADVLAQTAAVLASLTRSSGAMQNILSRPEFERLISTVVEGLASGSLLASSSGSLLASCVGCIYSARESNVSHPPQSAFARIASAVDARLAAVLQDERAFAAHAQRADVIAALLDGLDMLEGLAMSAAHPRAARSVYDFVARYLAAFPQLARIYARQRTDVVTSLLRVTVTLSANVVDQLDGEEEEMQRLNSALVGLGDALIDADTLGLASKARRGKAKAKNDGVEEAEPFEVLCLLLDLVRALLVAPLFPLSSSSSGEAAPFDAIRRAPDAALSILARLVPLLRDDGLGNALAVPRVVDGLVGCLVSLASHFSPRLVELAVSSSSFSYIQAWLDALDISLAATHDTRRLTDLVGTVSPLCTHISALVEARIRQQQQQAGATLHADIRLTFQGREALEYLVESLLACLVQLALLQRYGGELAPGLVEPLLQDGFLPLAKVVDIIAQGHAAQRRARIEGACSRALASEKRDESSISRAAGLVGTVEALFDVLAVQAGEETQRMGTAKAILWSARTQLRSASS